jgi:hypothetical protein
MEAHLKAVHGETINAGREAGLKVGENRGTVNCDELAKRHDELVGPLAEAEEYL